MLLIQLIFLIKIVINKLIKKFASKKLKLESKKIIIKKQRKIYEIIIFNFIAIFYYN